jgi:hypothetical protein
LSLKIYSIPTAPVSGGVTLRFRTSRGAGAVLVTDGEIERKELNRDLLALNWVLDPRNMAKILVDWEEISQQKRSLWMITNTYTAKRCANAVLSSHESTVKLGVEAEVFNLLNAKPTVEWWNGRSDRSWNIYHGENVSSHRWQLKIGPVRLTRAEIQRCCIHEWYPIQSRTTLEEKRGKSMQVLWNRCETDRS